MSIRSKNISDLQDENKNLQREIEKLRAIQAASLKDNLVSSAKNMDGVTVLAVRLKDMDSKSAKTLAYNIQTELGDSVILFGLEDQGKATIMLTISEALTKSKLWHAGNIVKALATEINGSGGGQAFFATAGGTEVNGLDKALSRLDEYLK
jgi:alanyl-tRNA synthetase